MADRDPNQNGSNNNRMSRVSRTASFWVLMVLMSIVAVQVFRGQEEAASEFSFTEFKQELQQGNVNEVTVVDGRRVEGEFRSPVIREEQNVVQFFTIKTSLQE